MLSLLYRAIEQDSMGWELNMVLNDIKRFDEFSESCGNRYLAVRTIARWARDLGKDLSEYRISESKLIEIVLNSKYYSKSELAQRKIRYRDDGIEDVLEWISDNKISNKVIQLYRQSIKERHLLECKDNTFTEGQKSRINVLLRMLWYSTK